MKHVIDASQDLFSNLAHEASVTRGLDLADIVILCIDPNSEWLYLLEWIAKDRVIATGFSCCVTDRMAMKPILEVLPEITNKPNPELPLNCARLIALSDEGMYTCKIMTSKHLH